MERLELRILPVHIHIMQYMQIMQKIAIYIKYIPELTLVTAVGAVTLMATAELPPPLMLFCFKLYKMRILR